MNADQISDHLRPNFVAILNTSGLRVYTSVTRIVVIVCLLSTGLFLLPDRFSRAAATFTVNSLADTSDVVQGNGICADAGGTCTLRAALQEANALAGDDTIGFSVMGTINLTAALPNITSNINMNGPGPDSLTVRRDTGGDYRIFFIDNRIVSISGMTITNGKAPDGPAGSGQSGASGGGIRQAGGELTLNNVIITANRTGNGATIANNDPGGRGGSGGGIEGSGVLRIANSQITNPTATHKPLTGSPALDAGNNALALDASNFPLTRDQRGAGRFANSAGPGTGTVDIGAFEFHPVMEDIPDKPTLQNQAEAISFSVGDPVNEITVTATSDNQALVPNANLAVFGNGTVRTLLIGAANQPGSTLITVTIFSAGTPVASDTFTLTVTPVNQQPSFTPGGNQTTNEDSGGGADVYDHSECG